MLASAASRKNALKVVQPSLNFVRGKRTKSKGGLNPQAQRIITQLSVMSASRKQPKLLKLSREDLIKHDMIQASLLGAISKGTEGKENKSLETTVREYRRSYELIRTGRSRTI